MKRVYVNEEWCLGCHLCEYNCAFANSGLSDMVLALKDKPIFPRIHVEGDERISYAVSCRHCPYGALAPNDQGVMQKCELCLQNACGKPACVKGCPNRAIVYEEREDAV